MRAFRESQANKFAYQHYYDFRFLNRFAAYMHKHQPVINGEPCPHDWKKGERPDELIGHLIRHVMDLGLFLEGVGTITDEKGKSVKYEDAILGAVFNLQALWRMTCGPDYDEEIDRGATP